MSDDLRRRDLAIDRFWNALVTGADEPNPEGLDNDTAAQIRRLHTLVHTQSPAGAQARLQQAMDRVRPHTRSSANGKGAHMNGTAILAGPFAPALPGHQQPRPGSLRQPALPGRARRRVASALSVVASIALIAAVSVLMFAFYNQNHQATPAPALASPTPSAATWPIYRGNAERNGAMPGPGIQGEPAILWQYAAKSPARVAPVTAGGTIFLSPDGPEFTALDAQTGEIRWQAPTTGGPPAAMGDLVYLQSEDGSSLVARDTTTSEEVWRVGPGNGFWSPLLSDGALYYGGDPNVMMAYDAKTGAVIWASAALGYASRSAALGDGVLVVGTDDHLVYGIDQVTGATRWSFDVANAGTLQTPAILDGVVYIGGFGAASNSFVALDLQTGELVWRFEGVEGEGFWAPGASGDLVYVPSDGRRLYALDAKTGVTRWTYTAAGPMKSAPAIIDGIVYAAGDDGVLVALDAATGEETWHLGLEGAVTFGPIIVDGVLYISTGDGNLYAIGGTNESPASASPIATSTQPAQASFAEFEWAASGDRGTQLVNPMVARLSPDRTLWVSDSSGRFFIFDLDGNLIETWGKAGTEPGQFIFSDHGDFGGFFAFAPDGTLYVADTFNQRIQHFDQDRNLIGSFGENGSGDGQFLAPMEIGFDPSGNLVIVDAYRADVQWFSPDGTFLKRLEFSSAPGGPILWPNGLAVAGDGSIWVGDHESRRVRHFGAGGEELNELDASTATPLGTVSNHDIVIDDEGLIYVPDQDGNMVNIFSADGRFVAQWGTFGDGDDEFSRPTSIALNRGGTAYVAQWRSGRVQKFTLTKPFPSAP